jgi:predicted ATPase/class 3 adenylate cyclase
MISPPVRSDLPTGAVTFLFTDVEGSTKLLRELGAEGYAQALAEHRRIVRKACATEGGAEVDTQGDAFFFAFASAPAAVAAAQAITDALDDGMIQLRIGLHSGTPLVTDEGYVGDDVHLAARIAASGHGGQVVLSRATRDLVNGLSVTDLGEHRLKDIDAPISIFQTGSKAFPPLTTISNTNLPRPASSFVGRARELEGVLGELAGGARLLTLTGTGGSGKTRLAIEAATTLVTFYKAGVFWVGLASVREPSLVTDQIAQTLGARDGLVEHIGEREMLLLLDNLEQVVDAAPELSTLLRACPNLTLLCTSRELLRLDGEVEYEVPPLVAPEALALFCERSRLEPSEEVAELCSRLDNLPLAVELAAARTNALSPAQILERLSQRLDLLKGGRDADPRQLTLRTAIAWSYDLLSEMEMRLFRSLAVFTGGCTLEAAEEVADASLDTLLSLVEKSLLRFTEERYWMLETIREYAGERLDETEREVLLPRHARHYMTFAERAERELAGLDEASWLRSLDAEQGNFRQALTWLGTDSENELRLRLVGVLWHYWLIRGQLREGGDWLESTVAASSGGGGERRANAQYGAAVLASVRGDYALAESHCTEAMAEYRRLADSAGVGRCLTALGNFAVDTGDYGRAKPLYEESAELYRDLDDRRGVSNILGNLAILALHERAYQEAAALAHEAVDIQREIGNREGLALSLATLGLAHVLAGNSRAATSPFAEALELSHELGYKHVLAFCIDGVAALSVASRPGDSARLFGATLELRESIGMDSDPATALVVSGQDEARRRLGASHFDRALAAGRLLSTDEAVALALACLE